jgi:hypothetical protein
MKSNSHFLFIKLSASFVMTIILSFSDTDSLSSVVSCCTTVAIFNVSLLVEMGACTDRPVGEISQSQSQNYFMTGGLPPISSSWRQAL